MSFEECKLPTSRRKKKTQNSIVTKLYSSVVLIQSTFFLTETELSHNICPICSYLEDKAGLISLCFIKSYFGPTPNPRKKKSELYLILISVKDWQKIQICFTLQELGA